MTKNKISLLLFFFLVCSLSLSAQSGKVLIGLEGGSSLRSMYGEKSNNENRIGNGFFAGINFEYKLREKLSLRTGVAFERKGFESRMIITDQNGEPLSKKETFNYNFDYIVLPVLVRYRLGKKDRFFVNAGPYFGYLLQQQLLLKSDVFPGGELRTDDTRMYRRFDYGISAGFGATIYSGEHFILCGELRNNLGLNTVSKTGASIRNNSLGLIFSMAYKLGA